MIRKRDVNELSRNERTMLESLVDACMVATTSMTILYVNKQLLKLTGFTFQEVVGRNVQMLMPIEVAKNHEGYANAYLGTGQTKVIGKGRQVQVQRKDKSLASCWLSVTEQKKASGRHTFLGTLHEVQSKARRRASSSTPARRCSSSCSSFITSSCSFSISCLFASNCSCSATSSAPRCCLLARSSTCLHRS